MTYLDPLLDRLAAFEPTTLPVLSLYLNTSPDQHGRDNFESFLIDCETSLDLNAISRIPAMNQRRTESTPT